MSKFVRNCQDCWKWSKLSKIVNIVENYQNCQNSQKMSKLSKIVQTIKNCQKLSKLSKIVKVVKIVENCWKLSKNVKTCQNFQKNFKMLDRSCFLITLIKCLKGHKSLGSLCNVTKVKVTQWLTDAVTRSPIELLWTAKKWLKLVYDRLAMIFIINLYSHLLAFIALEAPAKAILSIPSIMVDFIK